MRVARWFVRRKILGPGGVQLSITKEHHEAEIHVVLLMAVEQRKAWVVGGELNDGFSAGINEDRIFVDAADGHGRAGELGDGEEMTVQMDGMIVSAVVLEAQTVSLPALQDGLRDVGEGLSVDGPLLH